MTPSESREDWIVRQALERPLARRTDFLDGACAGDEALRERMQARINEQEKTSDPPSSTAQGPGEPTSVSELPGVDGPGAVIGRYRLLEKIGEGGFGVIYAAEQNEPVRRRVALKIIKLDGHQAGRSPFRVRAAALAMMDHPNIAKVLDAGATEAGRPYFVMELVRGIRITDYCDQANLPTNGRLDLFTPVCRAIQHAHQKAIIHRDLKPSNILVAGSEPAIEVKVIDFGIAKAMEQRLTDNPSCRWNRSSALESEP